VLAETNNQLSESSEGMTTTAFLGIVDLTTGVLTYVNAGHCVPLVKHAGKDFAPLPAKNCFMLGSMAGVPYWQQSIPLVQGDLLFLYTKGLAEAENGGHVQYSAEHMQMRLDQAVKEEYTLDGICRIMTGDVEDFLGGVVRRQDIAMLLFRFFG
jgi:sigma-B regulation protein RsbU (phosphoserine phosphatase)